MMTRAASLLALAFTACAEPAPVNDIYWSDGDSGRVEGVAFRLADVDAPETGAVGSWYGAKCEAERTKGYRAKAFMVEQTRFGELEMIWDGEIDRHDRRVIRMTVNGKDLSARGLKAGHLQAWPHVDGKAFTAKPGWC